MRIAFGTDEVTTLTRALEAGLSARGHVVERVVEGGEWPEVGRGVGLAVRSGRVERGIVCCTTGTGVAMAANKVSGVRAALCTDAETARGARAWNDANVLAFGLRLTREPVLWEMVEAFLDTDVDPDERAPIDRLEDERPE